MLHPDEVIPFLLHDDLLVRTHALRYFERCNPSGSFTADQVWAGIEKFAGTRDALSFATYLADAPFTENSLLKILRAIGREDAREYRRELYLALAEAPLASLERHRAGLASSPGLIKVLDERLRNADQPTAVLWQRLMDFARKLEADDAAEALDDDEDDWDEDDDLDDEKDDDRTDESDDDDDVEFAGVFEDESGLLIAALGERGEEAGELALEVLNEKVADPRWRDDFAIRVLGRARFKPAIGALIERMTSDSDALWESSEQALVRIGGVEVVEALVARYPTQDTGSRISVRVPLTRIKLPESEAAILKLIGIEKDYEMRVGLLSSLTLQGSMKGLEASRVLINSNLSNAEVRGLCEDILATAVMAGVDLPEAARWREKLDERERRHREALKDPDHLLKVLQRMRNSIQELRPAAEVVDELTPRPDEITIPIQRPAQKVGRNDPCPCGSGKKYKKCCVDK